MTTADTYGVLSGDSWLPALSARNCESQDQYSVRTCAVIRDAGRHDADVAAREAPDGPRGALTGLGRASPEDGRTLVVRPLIKRIAFIGSTAAGNRHVRRASENLARVSPELGGKSAQVVFDDAGFHAAANGVVAGTSVRIGVAPNVPHRRSGDIGQGGESRLEGQAHCPPKAG